MAKRNENPDMPHIAVDKIDTEEQEMENPDSRMLSGSRARCLVLTGRSPEWVAGWLTGITSPYAFVNAEDRVIPRGYLHPDELVMNKAPSFIPGDMDGGKRKELAKWWLRNGPESRSTPNWDIAAHCRIDGTPGLILVEAKAHTNETLNEDKCHAEDTDNIDSIAHAITDANAGLLSIYARMGIKCEWKLDACTHYQLANRFAWGWKLASMGIPVVLIYLGFLNAEEMSANGRSRIFRTHEDWMDFVHEYARDIVPEDAWERKFCINGTSFIPLIRSADIRLTVAS